MSTLPPIEGTISAKPFTSALAGRVNGSVSPPRSGSVNGSVSPPRSGSVNGCVSPPRSGSVIGDSGESPQTSAVAEIGNLITSLGSLSAQAQSLPLSAPTLPGLPQNQSYRSQATDYTQFNDDSN
jgi:hypothetical protein